MNNILNIENSNDLLNFELEAKDLPEITIMHPSLLLPLQDGITIDATFEIRDAETMPYNMRESYQHPGNYSFASFATEVREQLRELKSYVKRGNNLVFVVDTKKPNSLFNASSFLGEVFKNCAHHPDSPYPDFTDVPFPLRLSISAPQCWLWSCHWPKNFQRTIANPENARLFAEENNNLHFPPYDGHHCCFETLEKTQEGVTAFYVNASKSEGKIVVIPATTNIDKVMAKIKASATNYALLEVLEFPRIFGESQRNQVRLRLLIAGNPFEYKVSLLRFLRFLVLYSCSTNDRQFGFLTDGKKASDLKLIEGKNLFELPYEFLFKTRTGSLDSNFFSVLTDVRSCILNDSIPETERKQLANLCFFEEGKGRKYEGTYLLEKIQNTILDFSHQAIHDFMSFEIPQSAQYGTNQHASKLEKCLGQFKADVQSLL